MSLRALAAVLLISASGVTAVAAQDDPRQTPENAARFLRQILPGTTMAWDGNDGAGADVLHDSPYEPTTASPRVCDTAFRARYRNRHSGVLQANSHTVFWRSVREVSQQGGTVTVIDAESVRRYALVAEGTAARVAYAMEFLRQHCDPGADTGF